MRPEKQLVKNTWLHAEKYNFGYCLYLVSNNQTDLDITWAFIAVLQSTYRLRKLFCAKAQIFLPDIFSGAHSKMQLSIIQKQCGQWNIIPKVPSAAIRCFHPTFTGSTQAHTQTSGDQVQSSSIPAEGNGTLSDTLECLGAAADGKGYSAPGKSLTGIVPEVFQIKEHSHDKKVWQNWDLVLF